MPPSPTETSRPGNMAALIGTATHNGRPTAIRITSNPGEGDLVGQLVGDERLTATFGDGTALGTISGAISTVEDINGLIPGLGLTPRTAPIPSRNAGFFNGTASTRSGRESFAGKGGGQFHGNGTSPADHPGSVVGKFRVSNGDGPTDVVGTYGTEW